ncbi:uncharacterized protein RHOBADRAFT_51064 [Rhodotorula graminis WP1]|uniref:Uncharacterized protein n=1 Tax=Rhodotorula graminis (strain WP1) TaxID=578459 RepID=A0A194SDE9_RHOGW|nr:uncharacterized protein RHOBADRAFT_51064 [Rhodotorula graminis WP1]KPV78617.1 hypothetical protein RHOBADRAFT_51064 [Rhodotorula graminis WP1]
MSMPAPPVSFPDHSHPHQLHHHHHQATSSLWHPEGLDSPKQVLSTQHYRDAVDDVQSVLYGGRGRDRDEISRVVGDLYDSGATFENPLTLARGRDAVSDMFALLALVPGTMWSEMGDLTESRSAYDGNRLVVFTHTLHISLLPSLDSDAAAHAHAASSSTGAAHPSLRRSISFFSLPSTPYPQTPSSATMNGGAGPETPGAASEGIFSKTHPALGGRDRWPSASVLSMLSPRAIASALTTLHLKLHTRLLFNEEGRITAHEDLWGVKELVEGVFPVVGHLYAVNRQGLGWLARIASRTLLGSGGGGGQGAAQAHKLAALPPGEGKQAGGDEEAQLEGQPQYRTPRSAAASAKSPYGAEYSPTSQGGAGALGLDIGERAVATTLDDE